MSNKEYNDHNLCFLARIVLEAQTPLKIGSGTDNIKTDATINRDANGLPFIPASTIMGLMRHALDKGTAERMMGWQDRRGGRGSWLTVSEAKIVVDAEGHAYDGLHDPGEVEADSYLSRFREMPIRQHVRISHKGTAADMGKFDEEIIPKGARFCFEMELRADGQGRDDFNRLIGILSGSTFRVGAGSRKGFGRVSVEQTGYKELDFTNRDDFMAYVEKSPSLAKIWPLYNRVEAKPAAGESAIHYRLELRPVDFILFSSGFGDKRSDMTVVKEPLVSWETGRPEWIGQEKTLVVPASSVKGAVAHRAAFYYNLSKGVEADKLNTEEEREAHTGKNNEAVRLLFGSEGITSGGKTTHKRRGHVLFSDVVRKKQDAAGGKVLNHVKIDRFTGGAIDGALFAEEPLYARDETIELDLYVLPDKDIDGDKDVTDSLERALRDICDGTLPLGGGVNRGNGCFHGKLFKNDNEKPIYDYDQEQH